MEFKGTKGKWRAVVPEGYGKDTLIMNGTDIVAKIVKFEGKRYNAQLISKAPEMLEMLKTLLDNSDVPNEIYEQAKKLIKEAAEI